MYLQVLVFMKDRFWLFIHTCMYPYVYMYIFPNFMGSHIYTLLTFVEIACFPLRMKQYFNLNLEFIITYVCNLSRKPVFISRTCLLANEYSRLCWLKISPFSRSLFQQLLLYGQWYFPSSPCARQECEFNASSPIHPSTSLSRRVRHPVGSSGALVTSHPDLLTVYL